MNNANNANNANNTDYANNANKFRYNAKTTFITIKGHIGDDYIEFINNKYPIKKWIYCNELADETDPYEHSHVCIEFVKRINVYNCRVFDFKEVHPNFKAVEKWDAAVNYCMKEGKFKANFTPNERRDIKATIDNICKAKTVIEAVKENATSLRDVVPIIQIHKSKCGYVNTEVVERLKSLKLNEWQQKVVDIIEGDSDRFIWWFFETVGGVGKTTLLKWIIAQNIENTCIINGMGKVADMLHVFRNHIDTYGKEPMFCVLNLPRICADRENIYSFMEMLKDGIMTCTKYNSANYLFNPPTVIVMANWAPMTDQLSADRWKIFRITTTDQSMALVPVTLRELAGQTNNWDDDD